MLCGAPSTSAASIDRVAVGRDDLPVERVVAGGKLREGLRDNRAIDRRGRLETDGSLLDGAHREQLQLRAERALSLHLSGEGQRRAHRGDIHLLVR